MFTAAFTRLSLYGLLAVAPSVVDAQMPPQWVAERMVKRLSDSDLSCAEIHAETSALEKTGQAQQAEVMQAQEAMAKVQEALMERAGGARGGMGSAIGGGLLGMVPGGAQIQAHAMQAAAEARRAGMQEGMQKMMQAQTRLMNAEQALEHVQARSEHLTDLFLRKGCRLSEVKAAVDAAP